MNIIAEINTLYPELSSLSLSDQAYLMIEHLIVAEQLKPGVMISEKLLCENTKLGRTPVREALMRLEREGLVEIHPRRGAMITKIELTQQMELLEVRRPLQILAAKLGAARAEPEEREILKCFAKQIRQAAVDNDTQRSMAMNRTVHELEAAVAKNSMLEASLTLLQSMSRRFWFAFVKSKEETVEGANLHATLLEKMAEANVDEAEKAANNLLLFLDNITKKQIESAYSRHFSR